MHGNNQNKRSRCANRAPEDATPANEEKEGVSHRPTSALKLDFRRARLQTVLNYLYDMAGLIIHVNPNVKTEVTIDLCNDQPVSAADAIPLLRRVLSGVGCTVVQKGALFSIIRNQDLKKNCIPLPSI